MSAPWRSSMPMAVLGTGAALPGESIDSARLITRMSERFGFSAVRRARALAELLGIGGRHIVRDFTLAQEEARPGDSNPELCARAVRAALAQAGLAISDVAFLIGHTTSPASLLPANIALVADALGYAGPHVELRQACTGFASALTIASGLVAADPGAPVVIVGSETGSLYFDPHALTGDDGQLVNLLQMGDGAGAVALAGAQAGAALIEATWYGAIGLGRRPGISLQPGAPTFSHDFAAIGASGHLLFEAGRNAAAELGFDIAAVERFIPHQASGRIGAQIAAHFGLPAARAFVNADRIGNTGSAAIWIAFDAFRREAARGERTLVLGAEASKFMYGGFAYHHQ